MVGTRDRTHYHIKVVQQPRAAPGQVQARADVEDDQSAIWVVRSRVLEGHAP
jgi:hypothetical protein